MERKVLLHACCAPCSLSCIGPLREEGIEPVAFWYNPNIHPWKEYEARRDCLLAYAPTIVMEVRVLEEYGLREFVRHVAEDIAGRCTYCYDHRLETAARYAAENGVDPALVSAVILCESSFDPQAESRLGARGLMQLMEPTAQWAAESLNEDEGYSFDLLYDPETNVRFGTWYLGYLSRRFDGDILKVVCGYHAGQGNVDAWLANPKYSPDGVTLQNVPEGGTSTYAQRVMNAYEIYRKYYFPPQPSAMA